MVSEKESFLSGLFFVICAVVRKRGDIYIYIILITHYQQGGPWMEVLLQYDLKVK